MRKLTIDDYKWYPIINTSELDKALPQVYPNISIEEEKPVIHQLDGDYLSDYQQYSISHGGDFMTLKLDEMTLSNFNTKAAYMNQYGWLFLGFLIQE